jgi:hypothetical protein
LRQPAAAKGSNPLTLQEVSYALREGIEPKRVATLARERGLEFELTSESENQLRKAGADELLLNEFKKIRSEVAQRNKSANQALKEMTSGLAGLRDSLNYTIAHTPQGKFWDPTGEIRKQIQSALALLAARPPDLPKIISMSEPIGQRMEEEIDLALRDERDEFRRTPR